MLIDLRYALRTLLRAPGFAIAAILTLALGIGASTTIFSVVDTVLLRPLPYPDSNRLVMVWNQLTKLGLNRINPEYRTAAAYRSLDQVFESTGGILFLDRILTGDAGAERVPSMMVSDQVFSMLAPHAERGRVFTSEEYRANAVPVAVISRSFFLRRFSGDPAVIGKSINLDGVAHRVVGVMSPSFEFSLRLTGVDVWTPRSLDNPKNWGNQTRMIAKLRPGVSITAAQSALDAAAKHVDETEHPYTGPHGEDAGYRVQVISLREQLLGEYRTVTVILLCAVAAVLLIACVNVANLLLVRAVTREKETTMRRALGATGARLMAQWITESALLALLGGALGSIAAIWAVKLLVRISSSALPSAVTVDGRALLFTLAISCVVCFLFGLAPALASTKMTWGARGVTRQSRRAASTLVTLEVALAVMLMIGAGLLLKSFSRLRRVDPGFNPVHLLTMQVQFPPTRPISIVRMISFYTELRERLARLPGVISATQGMLPVRGGGVNAGGGDPFMIKGRPYDSSGPVGQFANLTGVGPDYFRTFEIPLRTGRLFTPADYAAPPPAAVIVNEAMARAFFPQGAIGQEIGLPKLCADLSCGFDWSTIVGIAADVKTTTLDRAPIPQIYMPMPGGSTVVLRTVGEPTALTHEVAALVRSMDPDMPVFDVKTMEDRIAESIGQPRFETAIVAFFAAAALFLAAIGIFGVVAHSTAQRTHEIGIRMALGADRARVIKTVMFDGLRPVIFGIAIGLAGAFFLTALIKSALFQVAGTDPQSFGIAAALLGIVAAAACLVPASRATKVDPMIALRQE
ncbi:MAG TPA: ABC transporter permease [Bryobacteraceae bacterium]|jgi:putative ABC transport system permease protein|nr:ABC transporter permease [Bryobacteraceae bacterium]